MGKLNIKITEIDTGNEILNEDTNTIIGGIADDEGNCVALVNVAGNGKSLLGALEANDNAKENVAEQDELKELIAIHRIRKLMDKLPDGLAELLVDDEESEEEADA